MLNWRRGTAVAAIVAAAVAAPHTAPAPAEAAPDPRLRTFSGQQWMARTVPGNPGVNQFWRHTNVQVDARGRLHLKVTRDVYPRLRFAGAEVQSVRTNYGYGTYIFDVDSNVHAMHDNLVLGMFIHDAAGTEVDVEASNWGWPGVGNWDHAIHRANAPAWGKQFKDVAKPTRHIVRWTPGRVEWTTQRRDTGAVIGRTVLTTNVPRPKPPVQVGINFWIFQGSGPSNYRTTPTTTAVLSQFRYVPA